VIGIKANLIIDPEGNENGNRHTHGQAADIDNGRGPALEKITPGGFEIIDEHRFGIDQLITKWMPVCKRVKINKLAGCFHYRRPVLIQRDERFQYTK
jgi:hypothetical protein